MSDTNHKAPASPAPSASPQYYVGADRGDLWIPVHMTGCATEEEARKVLDLVRKGDEDGGPFAVIRSYEDFTPTQAPSLSTLRAQIEGLPRYKGQFVSRNEVLALFDALTIPEEK